MHEDVVDAKAVSPCTFFPRGREHLPARKKAFRGLKTCSSGVDVFPHQIDPVEDVGDARHPLPIDGEGASPAPRSAPRCENTVRDLRRVQKTFLLCFDLVAVGRCKRARQDERFRFGAIPQMVDQIRNNPRPPAIAVILYVLAAILYVLVFACFIAILAIAGQAAVYDCQCTVESVYKAQVGSNCVSEATSVCTCAQSVSHTATLESGCGAGVDVGHSGEAFKFVSGFLGRPLYSWKYTVPFEHYLKVFLMLFLVLVAVVTSSVFIFLMYHQRDERGDHPDVAYGPLDEPNAESIV